MQRVKRSTAVAVLPAAPAGGTPGYFAAPNPTGGVQATVPGYEWYNGIQEELMAVIESQGLAGSSADNTLLRQAITKMIQAGQRSVIIDNAVFAPAVTGTGKVVYWDSANTRFDLALADGSAKQSAVGVADVANGKVYSFGDAVLFAGLTPGSKYYLDGVTAGAMTAVAPGNNSILIGIAKSATEMFVDIDVQPTARIRLTANKTFYVATTGNDANDGLTAGTPFATIQKAWNTIQQGYDLNGYTATIQLADGTYTAGVGAQGALVGQLAPGQCVINGNAATPSNVVISTTSANAINASTGAMLQVQNVKLQTTTSGAGVQVSSGAQAYLGAGIIFGACATAHIVSTARGSLTCLNSYTVSGASLYHFYCTAAGRIDLSNGITVTLTGTPAFSVGFAVATDTSLIFVAGIVFSGAATGTRYTANANSVIETAGGGASYLPGNVAGSTSTGAQYV